jgi:hypothetical protein
MESVSLEMSRFILFYRNEAEFFRIFSWLRLMPFLGRYNNITKLICYGIVLTQNVLLITDQIFSLYFDGVGTQLSFGVLALLNLLVAFLILVVFLLRDLPLIVRVERHNLGEGVGFLSEGFRELSAGRQRLVLFLKTVVNLDLCYHVVYTVVTALTLYNKLFVAVLLLDVLAHIPALRTCALSQGPSWSRSGSRVTRSC